MPDATATSVRRFYDELAPDYHRIFADWDASMDRQARALDALLGPARRRVLDCACGIGTQAIGLARRGHDVTGSDLSPVAAARATAEAAARGVRLPATAGDLRALPFAPAAFDAVVCADNSLPHLLTEADVHTALTGMRRVLRADGLLILTVRDYDALRRTRPASTPPQTSTAPDGATAITFQLWHWHDDGERYDLRHFQLVPDGPDGADWRVRERRTTYWALTARQLTDLVTRAGFTDVTWHSPEESGFYQPVLTARR
ncbi:methyltransferase domain-containing protein [Streptomyces sp. NPDC052225]|uniref:class I SAM-dependent methyltransferase n=1 Tax=Streptomyces sp. NPDC052225 TaxID=3154949 RepID=UPI00342CB5FB